MSHNPNRLLTAGALLVFLGAVPADAQLFKEEKGPGLGATPIEIPVVLPKALHPITNLKERTAAN